MNNLPLQWSVDISWRFLHQVHIPASQMTKQLVWPEAGVGKISSTMYLTFGVAIFKWIPNLGAAIISEWMILLPSPTHAIVRPYRLPKCSWLTKHWKHYLKQLYVHFTVSQNLSTFKKWDRRKQGINKTAKTKRRNRWTNLKKIETHCNWGLWKPVSITVFQSQLLLFFVRLIYW